MAANDDACGKQSRLAFQAQSGQSYLIAVDGQRAGTGAATGSVELRLRTAHPPLNDAFANPAELEGELPIAIEESNFDATREAGEPEHGGPGGASLWYRWTPAADARVAIETCGGQLDTLIGVYTGDALASPRRRGHGRRQLWRRQQRHVRRRGRRDVPDRARRQARRRPDPRRFGSSRQRQRRPSRNWPPPIPPRPRTTTSPRVIGTAPGSATVRLYVDDPTCEGEPDASGTAAELEARRDSHRGRRRPDLDDPGARDRAGRERIRLFRARLLHRGLDSARAAGPDRHRPAIAVK